MLDGITSAPFLPFAAAVAILFALLVLELVLLLLGGSLMLDGAAPEIGAPDVALPDIEAVEAGTLAPAALADAGGPDAAGPAGGGPAAPGGWTGFGHVPFLVWLAALLTGFGGTGLALQSLGPWPLVVAVPVAAVAGVAFARGFAGLFARMIPQTETASQTLRQLSRRRGMVTQGTAARGRAAEVRLRDRHGNTHYVRAEPLRDPDVIAQGSEVLVLWDRRTSALRLVEL